MGKVPLLFSSEPSDRSEELQSCSFWDLPRDSAMVMLVVEGGRDVAEGAGSLSCFVQRGDLAGI